MNDNRDIRWVQRFSNYNLALENLLSAVELDKKRELSDLEKQGLIQAFEFTHELAWNTLRDFLKHFGYTEQLYGSRDATQAAVKANLIEDGMVWMDMIKSRNLSVHAYNRKQISTIYNKIITDYASEFKNLQSTLKREQSKL
ncbi:MAG: nucleotidyltransferase substrate binding protein [Kiritimatiellae bacterium]|jgi:nucleotidyltransferase substrate binding protein (TIGR01987 family)|nr:nucleotidyltransferase substrate binding protein [Kiritimatiellia bacterium]